MRSVGAQQTKLNPETAFFGPTDHGGQPELTVHDPLDDQRELSPEHGLVLALDEQAAEADILDRTFERLALLVDTGDAQRNWNSMILSLFGHDRTLRSDPFAHNQPALLAPK